MDQIISPHQISTTFGITINRLQQLHRTPNTIYYKAITIYGSMCLIIQHYADSTSPKKLEYDIKNRNKILDKYSQCFPLIYGQQLTTIKQQIICLSLIENIEFMHTCFQSLKYQLRISSIQKLVKSLFYLSNQLLTIKGSLSKQSLIYCHNTRQVYINFTNITNYQLQNQETVSDKIINLIQWIQQQRYKSHQFLKQLILIHDKIYRFDIHLIKSAKNIVQIMIMLNICLDLQVDIQIQPFSKINDKNSIKCTKIRTTKIKQLVGNQKFVYHGVSYQSLQFFQGKCINSFIQVQYNQLKLKFLKFNSHYRLRKHQNFFVQIKDNHQHIHLQQDVMITVHPPVSKIQLINFIIIYIKCIQPIIKSIIYNERQNSIRIQFINKTNQIKTFKIIFYDKYTVKDQQISMILQRGKIKDCKLDVRYMKINDTLLMFLGNSQKTDKIHELLLSDSHGLSDHGINVLLVSPFCKNLHSLTLYFDQCLLTSSLQLLSLKSNIKKLYLKNNHIKQQNSIDTNQQTINLSKIKLTELSTYGIKINLNQLNPSNLKILKITQYIQIDQLKNLKNFQLTQLKIKIIEPLKKNIIQSTSHLLTGAMVWKQNGIKIFAQGLSCRTLKILDLAQSNVKFKTIKPLFHMPQLQHIILDNCTNLGNEFQPISPKIVKISFLSVNIQIQHLISLLEKTQVLTQLNIINVHLISKDKFIKFLTDHKKYIKKLLLSQHNYSNRFIQRIGGIASVINYQMVQNVSLYIDSLLNLDQQHILFSILNRVCETQKKLNMMTYYGQPQQKMSQQQQAKKKKLLSKINNFIHIQGKKIKQLNNLSIDNYRFQEINLLYQTVLNTDLNQYLDSSFSLFSCSLLPPPTTSHQKPKIFTIFPNQTIDKVLHRFVRFTNKINNQSKIIFDMNHNRLIDKPIINILLQYAQNMIISINFANTLFKFQQVVDLLFEFPKLEQVNQGNYQIILKKNNLISRSQNYLKFFMRIQNAKTLIINCQQIQQIQLLYFVLSLILDKHSSTLLSLKIHINILIINNESDLFIDKIFTLKNLQQLQLKISSYKIKNNIFKNWQDDINNLSLLKSLTLKLPTKYYPQLNHQQLQYLNINFSDQDITEHIAHKIIKNIYLSPIKQLYLNFGFCTNIIHLNKIFISHSTTHLFDKLQSLQIFSLDLQYCNIKQQSLNQTILSLTKCQHLKQIKINASFTITNLKQLQHSIHYLKNIINHQLKIFIIAVNGNSHTYTPNQDFNSQNNIEFII